MNILRAASLSVALAIGLAGLLGAGCGGKVSARAQPKTVTQWKYHPRSEIGIPKGLIVEDDNGKISARFCDLKPGPGFSIHSTLAHGQYLPERKALVFAFGMPEMISLEQWLQAGGSHLIVPYSPKDRQLTGTLMAAGANQSFDFVAHR